jgi:hypothetical protein
LDVHFDHDADRFSPRWNTLVNAVAFATFVFVCWEARLGADVIVILINGPVGILANFCRPAIVAGAWQLIACRGTGAFTPTARSTPSRSVAAIVRSLNVAARLNDIAAILVAGRLLRPLASLILASGRRLIVAQPTAAATSSAAPTVRPVAAIIIIAARVVVAPFLLSPLVLAPFVVALAFCLL